MKTARQGMGFFLAACILLPVVQSRAQVGVQIGLNFTGSTFGPDSSSVPPDSDGAAGPSHYVELINGRFSVTARPMAAACKR